jgi:hypothetical protein
VRRGDECEWEGRRTKERDGEGPSGWSLGLTKTLLSPKGRLGPWDPPPGPRCHWREGEAAFVVA